MYGGLIFPNRVSVLMRQLNRFHDHTLIVLVIVTTLVIYWFVSTFRARLRDRFLMENQVVEVIWTLVPMVILVFIALPSLRLLYLLDEISQPDLRVKVSGRQWYWNYEYSEFPEISFESHLTEEREREPRLLEVDNRLTLPLGTHARVILTSTDVIHSWTVPLLGVKVDAIPGRLNQVGVKIPMRGVFFGQCSEICGANHSFMPIVVERVSSQHFLKLVGYSKWLNKLGAFNPTMTKSFTIPIIAPILWLTILCVFLIVLVVGVSLIFFSLPFKSKKIFEKERGGRGVLWLWWAGS